MLTASTCRCCKVTRQSAQLTTSTTIGGGAISPHKNAVLDDYTNPIDKKAAEFIANASSARFDGSDLMPAEVGSGSFWKGVTDYVSGSADLDQALTTIQNGWNNVKK